MQYAFLGLLLVGAAFAINFAEKPNVVELNPPGAVIFNPAPATGSATFLGSITGTPGQYWNITGYANQIPGNFLNPSGVSLTATESK